MKRYLIKWERTQEGYCFINADNEEKAEEKAETGQHNKISIIGNDSQDWTITDVEEN